MKLLKLSLALVALFYSFHASAQTEGSAFTFTGMGVSTPFARDYQTLGINVGNLDVASKYDKTVTFGFGEIALSLYSEILTKKELRQNLFRDEIKDFSKDEQKDYAIQFANAANAVNIDATSFGFSLKTNKIGTFAFKISDRVNFYSKIGKTVSELMWLGYTSPYFDSLIVKNDAGGFDTIPNTSNLDPQTTQNIVQGITSLANAKSLSQILDGTKIGMSWYREYNLGWGKRLFSSETWDVHAGVGGKFIVGQGILDINGNGGTATAFSSLSPIFNVDYGNYASNNPSALDSSSKNLKPVGYGYGIDLGTTIIFKKKFIASVAINDIGKITWDGNLYKLNDVQITSFKNPGLESVDFAEQFKQLNGSDGLLSWQGEDKRTTKLPTTARLGFGYDNNKSLKGGIDVILPVGDQVGSIQSAAIAVGGEYSPMPWLHLQAGFTQGGNYGTKIPVGIYFSLAEGSWEFGAASRDLVTFFKNNEPTISMAFGFLRFRV